MLTATITNFVCIGAEMWKDGSSQIRRLIPLTVENHDVSILIEPEYLGEGLMGLRGKNLKTASVHIPTAEKKDALVWTERLESLCELLGFAREARVGLCGLDWHDGTKQMNTTYGTIQTFRPVFSNGAEVAKFIEQVYPTYIAQKGRRELNVVTDYLWCSSLTELPLESKLANLFVLQENLKHTWALYRGYPKHGGYFYSHGSTSSKNGKRQTFKMLLDEMYGAVGMPPAPATLLGLRNDIVHTGRTGLSFEDGFTLLKELIGLHREYLLRLLGYHGEFYDFSLNVPRTVP